MFNIVWLYIASQKKKRLPESRVSTVWLSYSKSFFLILAHHLVLISDSDRPNQLSPSLLSVCRISLSLSVHVCMCLFCTTILHISKSTSYITYLCVCVCVCGAIHFVEQSISLKFLSTLFLGLIVCGERKVSEHFYCCSPIAL
jgi:hypothetical protein